MIGARQSGRLAGEVRSTMNSSRRTFLKESPFLIAGARAALAVPFVVTAAHAAPAEPIADTTYGRLRGRTEERHPRVPRRPLRRGHVRQEPLHGAAEARRVDGRARCAHLGTRGAATAAERQLRLHTRRPVGQPARRTRRRLPGAERLDAGPQRRRQAGRHVLDSRRRLHDRDEPQPGLRRPRARPHRQRGGGHDQPPARRPGLPAPGRPRAGVRTVRRRGHDGHRGRARVGSRQHRELRRRPRPRHDLRPVGRRLEGLSPDGHAVGQGPVPPGRHSERRRHPVRHA